MKVQTVFLSINARDFAAQSEWWRRALGRRWDQSPVPDCHEWNLTDDVLLQVLDGKNGAGGATVTLRVDDLDAALARLKEEGIVLSSPRKVEGFTTLRYAHGKDPEGNTLGLLDGA